MAKIRLSIEVSQELSDFLDSIAASEDTTRTEIVRRALSVVKAFDGQRALGRTHLGFVDDPRKLDAEMLGILDSSPRGSSSREQRIRSQASAKSDEHVTVAAE